MPAILGVDLIWWLGAGVVAYFAGQGVNSAGQGVAAATTGTSNLLDHATTAALVFGGLYLIAKAK
ncbi:MAG TPA: hypothetical protein VNE82_03540 [Candidatus Binataceae bacterium]|nr:hypothetical protein [Candidatus Binataceae bacterium]